MHRARYIAVALVALLFTVAWPAAVVAQSAGEDQYSDPLQGGGSGGGGSGGGGSAGGGSSGGGSAGGSAGAGTDAPTNSAGSQSQGTTETPGQASATGAGDGLPRTGFPVAMLLIAGIAMVVSGFSLRRNA